MTVHIKSPESTRPFQHVLEPLSGYLSLAKQLTYNPNLSGQSFNFGPSSNSNYKVIDVVKELSKNWEESNWEVQLDKNNYYETKLLKLNCDKSLALLNWQPNLDFKTTMELTSSWYYDFYNKKNFNGLEKCQNQIKKFVLNKKEPQK